MHADCLFGIEHVPTWSGTTTRLRALLLSRSRSAPASTILPPSNSSEISLARRPRPSRPSPGQIGGQGLLDGHMPEALDVLVEWSRRNPTRALDAIQSQAGFVRDNLPRRAGPGLVPAGADDPDPDARTRE